VRDAGVEAIAQLPGFSTASAERLLAALLPPEPGGAPPEPAEQGWTAPSDGE
jgi:hypothetical protein